MSAAELIQMCFFKIHMEAKNVIQPIDCADLLTLIKATQILSELFSLGAYLLQIWPLLW